METLPAFVDETGVLTTSIREQPVYGIGLLLVQDPARVTDSFYRLHFNLASSRAKQRSELRKAIKLGNRSPSLSEVDTLMWSARHQEYKFSDVTPHNLQQYIDLLNLYFSFDCFKFHALLVDRSRPGFNLSPWNNDPCQAYVELGCELLRHRLTEKVFAIVDLQGQPKGASISVEQEFSSVELVSGCIRASSETQVFLQVVDVLLGCVQSDWKARHQFYAVGSKRANAKRQLVNLLRRHLELAPEEMMVSESRRVWERGNPSLFTVSLKGESAAMSGVHPG